MKKIILSLSVIAIVAVIVIGATTAYFSDTETNTGNTFSTGVIDITIGPAQKWSQGWTIDDMKPCETGYITFNIYNPGNNPVNVWKKIIVTGTIDEPINEPECVYGGGVWDSDTKNCGTGGYIPKSNLHTYMNYDLSVEVPGVAGEGQGWWQTIYKDEDNVRVSSINNKRIFLGMIPAGKKMIVTQSYHLIPETGNWAQADTMNFDIEIYAEQLTGSLVLENKTGDPDWKIIDDDYQGTLNYNLTGPTFNYSFTGKAPQSNTDYCLVYYADPWAGNNPGALIGCGQTDTNGDINLSGSPNLGIDLPDSADANFPQGAKIWLVTSSDYNSNNKTTGPMTGWTPADYLFETGLVTYDDTDN